MSIHVKDDVEIDGQYSKNDIWDGISEEVYDVVTLKELLSMPTKGNGEEL